MKFSEQWLYQWVKPEIDTETLVNQLTMAGLEVESVVPAANFSKVVVSEIIKLSSHPNADKLRVAQVNVGGSDTLQIVCGAKNARVGLKTATALVGAKLGENFKIKKSKLRGTESNGMMCSGKELGLDDNADGIIELPQSATVGQSLVDYLDLNDNIIEIDLTPNRGDCLSILGVAREVATINCMSINQLPEHNIAITSNKKIVVEVEQTDKCPIYLGRVIENINPKAKTPIWMQEKLRRGGIRSLGPLVDVTNYVALELGQPLHAFDLARISEKIIVRHSKPKETLTMLDGEKLSLKPETLIIADNEKSLAIAGVMGGLDSGISEQTASLFLECAYFDMVKIAGVARSYNMHTEASQRYERGVDYQLPMLAINRASQLLLEIVGGDCGEIITVNNIILADNHIPIKLTDIKRLLGIELTEKVVVDILTGLGMQITTQSNGSWLVLAPSFRFDINITADLIEEIGRIYGYSNIANSNISIPANLLKSNEGIQSLAQIKQFFIARDYQEIISYSFVSPKIQQILGIDSGAETLSNPISQDLSQMRTSLWPGLVKATTYNLSHQHKRIRLFETGLRFFRDEENKLQQKPSIAGLVCGTRFNQKWNDTTEMVNFYDVKYDLECLLKIPIEFIHGKHPSLHPRQTAEIFYDRQVIGLLGKIHPQVALKLDLPEASYLFELDLDIVQQISIPKFTNISKYPEISRDLAIMVDSSLPSSQIINTITGIANINLKSAMVFDVYKEGNIGDCLQSLAINIVLQAKDKTLTDDDITTSIRKIMVFLEKKYDAKLRN